MLLNRRRQRVEVDALSAHVRHFDRAHVQRLERVQHFVTSGCLHGDDVTRFRDGAHAQVERFGPSGGHDDVVGRAGGALAEHQLGDLPAQPDVAARLFVLDGVVAEGR